jgi:hypothetical protein
VVWCLPDLAHLSTVDPERPTAEGSKG